MVRQSETTSGAGSAVARGRESTRPLVLLRIAGAGLLIATAAIHLDLYLTGYRTIPTIGWLFLLEVIVAALLGAAVLVPRRALPAASGAAFTLATLGGYLFSLRHGLFGFREIRTTAGIVAGIVEVAAVAALTTLALASLAQPPPVGMAAHRSRALMRPGAHRATANWTSAGSTALAALLLGLGLATTSPTLPGGSARPVLKITTIKGVAVVTDARGFTLYWFVPDSPAGSTCYGTCAAYWPPVAGRPVAGAALTARLGAVVRSGGGLQATYDGHPLYTYVGDSAPGQANGNDIDLNGGLWHQMDASG